MAHVERDAQLDAKERWLRDLLTDRGVMAPPIERIAPEPGAAYRVRVRLAWAAGGSPSGALVGYRAARSRDIVVPDRCEVLAPPLEAARELLRATLAPLLVGEGEIRIGLDPERDHVVAAIVSDTPQPPQLYASLEALVAAGALRGVSATLGGASAPTLFGDAVERSLDVDGRLLETSIGSFRQGHQGATRALGERVLSFGEPEGTELLELYAGHGHFTLSLSARAEAVTAIELEPSAARALRANLERHHLSARVLEGDAARLLEALAADVAKRRRARPSVVILDPPRSGALDATRSLLELAPDHLVYVSCDPPSFARDAARLAPGYRLTRLSAIDLFPDTLHLELVSRFDRP